MRQFVAIPPSKRVFDLVVTVLVMPLWLPVCLIAAFALRISAGSPVIYRSRRRVVGGRTETIAKFRTMARNAEQLLNRETVPITDTCFLNIPPEHPVYTPVGRFLERFALTELPQLLYVLGGTMSLVGNRPLPENVVQALRRNYPYAEDRFLVHGGLTGPVQLIGRDALSDEDRLAIEIDYCLLSKFGYRWRVDALILWNTVMVALRLRPGYSVAQVRALLAASGDTHGAAATEFDRRQSALRFAAKGRQLLMIDGEEFVVSDFGYRGLRVTGSRLLSPASPLSLSAVGSESAGELCASVCWSRSRPDGRFEAGLSVAPGRVSPVHLGTLMSDVEGTHARSQPGWASIPR